MPMLKTHLLRLKDPMVLGKLRIVIAMTAIAHLLFYLVIGPLITLDAEKTAPANWMGNLFQGGFVIPLLISMLLILIAFVIERAIVIIKAKGKMNGAGICT